MKVVNIVPLELLDVARTKMQSAFDWSLQRWNEEGVVPGDEVREAERLFDSDIETRTKRSNDPFEGEEEEEDEEDDEEEEDDEVEEEENILADLGESEDDEEEEEVEVSDTDEDEVETEAYNEVVQAIMADAMEEAETEAINLKVSKLVMSPEHVFPVALSPLAKSPEEVPHGDVEMEVEGGQHDASKLQAVDLPRPEQGVQLPVASFSSGIPSTPGRGFMQLESSRQSAEQLDVQAMDVSDEDERPQSAEEPHVEASPSGVTRSRPSSRSKVKAPRKGKSTLPPPIGGDHTETLEHSGLDLEGESGRVALDTVMSDPAVVERTGIDLNVSSPVEAVAAVLEVLGQGRSHPDPIAVVVAEEPSVAEPSNEAEVVVRTEVICLDSDDDVPERRVELDVRVKVRDPVPRRVRGTFADYITDDSEDEDYGTPGYNRKKLDFIDDPHPLFAAPPDTNKDSELKEKVHFAPFVDKYLVEVPESVRLNLAHLYRSYDYHKMFAYLSTPAFCAAVKVKHVLHAASLKKMRKRWIEFEAPRHREGRGQFPGSSSAQAGSVVESTLEIIDVSGVPESPRREVHAAAAESSSPHVVHIAEAQPPTSSPHDDTTHAEDPPSVQVQGNIISCHQVGAISHGCSPVGFCHQVGA